MAGDFHSFKQRICQRILKMRDCALMITSLYSVFMFIVVCYLLHRSPPKVQTVNGRYQRFRFIGSPTEDISDTESTSPNRSPNTGYFILDTNETFTKRCSRCSLVSSSGHLYESGAGADIDSADCVIRMNTAPVTGWTEDVGARTDIRIIGHVNLPRGLVKKSILRQEILVDEQTRASYIIVPWLYDEKINMSTHRIFKIARDFKGRFPQVNFVFLTREKYEASERRFKLETGFSRTQIKTWFSTGFVSMMFALDVCDKVEVYGLSTSQFCIVHPKSKVPYHYYEPDGARECSFQRTNELGLGDGHKFMTERAMFARWSLIYDITFHYPSWKATIKNATGNLDTPFLRKYKEALKTGKLDDIPQYVYRNGKRYRVIYRRVPRKVARAKTNQTKEIVNKPPGNQTSENMALQTNDQNQNGKSNDTLIKERSIEKDVEKESPGSPKNDTNGIEKKAHEDGKSKSKVAIKSQDRTSNKAKSHIIKRTIVKRVVRKKHNQTDKD
ncbi:alpha-N-acetyl-neuraminyl-2,3-beta-galactosyl-1,3-N-acetyl-galactosaminide alpha-2,6-sialyltransferase-like [Lytechinus pictus]|uniref:alpha-N-acetyl-neuraminyl-2,3-beta-galactosyl-1, 3-N-acetyl-galactosaminide alpha-2,6-sialyltransferase-like n=1 Tax=Lytechinus pictus TaxID=7653 RepID=UPI0030BA1452